MLKFKQRFFTVLTMTAVMISSCIKNYSHDKRTPWEDKSGKGANEKVVLDIFYDNLFVDTANKNDSGYSEISTNFSADEKNALGGTGVCATYDKSGEHVIRGMQFYTCLPKDNTKYKKNSRNIDKIIFDFKYHIEGSHGRDGISSYLSKDAVVNIKVKTLYRSKVSLVSKKFKDLKVVNNDKPESTTMFLDRGEYTIKVYNGKNAK